MNPILLTRKQDLTHEGVGVSRGKVLDKHFSKLTREVDMAEAKITTDHEQIKRWVEERGGHPARVKGTAVEGSSGVLVIDYPGYSGTQTLETLTWDEFFQGFEENNLAFLYQEETEAGEESRFSKLVNRDSAEQKGRAAAS
jgi:bifunctional DNA primase/polymerase-like protein